MVDIEINTNTKDSFVVGRNGVIPIIAIKVWQAEDRGMLYINGVGVSGKVLNAGFVIDKKAAEKLLTKISEVRSRK